VPILVLIAVYTALDSW